MAGIAFVAREIDCPVDVNRQVGVDLNEAAVAALVVVVTAPRLVRDVFDGEALAFRQPNVLQSTAAALTDRRVEHTTELIGRDHKTRSEPVVALDERAAAGERPVELVNRLLEIGFGM